MSYIISEQRVKQFNSTQNRTEYSASIICDDEASLPTNNSDYWYLLGSDAKVISNGKKYIINSSGVWVEQPSENAWENVYTKAEVDVMINTIYDIMMYYHTEQESIDGTITFYTLGGNVGSLTIYGNGELNVNDVEFVGIEYENVFDRTGTIYPWNEAELTFSGNTIRATAQRSRTQCYAAILLSNTPQLLGKTLTLSATITQSTPTNTGGLRVFWYNGNYPALALYQDQPETGYATATFTVPDTIPDGMQCLCVLFTANWYGTCEVGDYVDYEGVMLNVGSTAEPYIPFGESGCKIPVTCAGQTIPIYIDEPLRKALDGSDAVDVMTSTGTITREVDVNGNALTTPTTQTIDFPDIMTISGENTLTIDTDLKPSKIVISGKSN